MYDIDIDVFKLVDDYPLAEVVADNNNGDEYATYILALYILYDIVKFKEEIDEEAKIKMVVNFLERSALRGCLNARVLLNKICMDRYNTEMSESNINNADENKDYNGPLIGFDKKKIKINRTGIRTPIDAKLVYEDGKNILKLSLDLTFSTLRYGEEGIENFEMLELAIIKGILDWEGEYTVFGGQKLTVEIEYTIDQKMYDSVFFVGPKALEEKLIALNKFGLKNDDAIDLTRSNRSFEANGKKWSVYNRKFICIKSKSGKFNEYDEIRAVAKHEFGHALGLGDLYMEKEKNLNGVRFDTYDELDGFYTINNRYNLVMCDHHGPVSNNDIEMVVLAFQNNEAQLYQKQNAKDKISKALGKGN